MADVFTKAKRSDVMSRIRSRGNKDTELALVKIFRREKITGWRRHLVISSRAALPRGRTFRVKPDFVFRKERPALFVDGCFWHVCPRHSTQPKNNAAFWGNKLLANQKRDRRVNRELRKAGWRVLRIWEHALTRKNEVRLVSRIKKSLY